jgi:hypothetical protein
MEELRAVVKAFQLAFDDLLTEVEQYTLLLIIPHLHINGRTIIKQLL